MKYVFYFNGKINIRDNGNMIPFGNFNNIRNKIPFLFKIETITEEDLKIFNLSELSINRDLFAGENVEDFTKEAYDEFLDTLPVIDIDYLKKEYAEALKSERELLEYDPLFIKLSKLNNDVCYMYDNYLIKDIDPIFILKQVFDLFKDILNDKDEITYDNFMKILSIEKEKNKAHEEYRNYEGFQKVYKDIYKVMGDFEEATSEKIKAINGFITKIETAVGNFKSFFTLDDFPSTSRTFQESYNKILEYYNIDGKQSVNKNIENKKQFK